jgi:hypothetical protein
VQQTAGEPKRSRALGGRWSQWIAPSPDLRDLQAFFPGRAPGLRWLQVYTAPRQFSRQPLLSHLAASRGSSQAGRTVLRDPLRGRCRKSLGGLLILLCTASRLFSWRNHFLENTIKPYVTRSPSGRGVIAHALIALLIVVGVVLCAGWLIGAIPAYPHMNNWEICTAPQVDKTSIYGTPKKALWMAICFDTTDSWEQVDAWYEPLGWTGQNVPTDEMGLGVTGRIDFGSVAQITIKRLVLVSPFSPSGTSVKVVTEYDLHTSLFSIP